MGTAGGEGASSPEWFLAVNRRGTVSPHPCSSQPMKDRRRGSPTNGNLPPAEELPVETLMETWPSAFSWGLLSQKPRTGVYQGPKYQERVHLFSHSD